MLGVPSDQATGTPDYAKAVILTFTVTAIVALDPEMDITDGGYGAPAVLVTAPFTATSTGRRAQLRHPGRGPSHARRVQ